MSCPVIVGREVWDAKPPKNVTKLVLPTKHILLGQTFIENARANQSLTYEACRKQLSEIQDKYMNGDNASDDIGANFLICGDGTIFEGTGWYNRERFRPTWDVITHSIYFMGCYRDPGTMPTAAALLSAKRLIQCGTSGPEKFVQPNYTIYGYLLNPEVPVQCDCGPIDRTSQKVFQTKPATGQPASSGYLFGTIGGVVILTLLLSLFFVWARKRRAQKSLVEKRIRLNCPWALAHFEISPKNISLIDPIAGIEKPLGKGNFGIVLNGQLSDAKATGSTAVAAKLIPEDKQCAGVMNAFAQQMEMLMKVGRHVNIMNFVGVVLVGDPMIVMEYCAIGSLDKFLRDPSNICIENEDAISTVGNHYVRIELDENTRKVYSVDDLVYFGYQVSRGMDFVSSRDIIHRDLAARNILLSSTMTVKIADFGMARGEAEYIMQSENVELPVRWLAPECMKRHGTYSVKSDVWSFGVVLWEIFSLGLVPYEEEFARIRSCEELRSFFESNGRLRQPRHASDTIFDVMQKCWAPDPVDRPVFSKLTETIGQLLPARFQQEYLKLDEEYAKFNETLDGDHKRYYSTAL